MSQSIQPVRPLMQRAVDLLESCHGALAEPWAIGPQPGDSGAAGMADLRRLRAHPMRPTFETLVRVVWRHSVVEAHPALWLLRDTVPEAALVFMLCTVAEVSIGRVFAGDLGDQDFARLTSAAGRASGAPLHLLRVDPSAAAQGVPLPGLLPEGLDLLVGDWIPQGSILESVRFRVPHVLFPASASRSR